MKVLRWLAILLPQLLLLLMIGGHFDILGGWNHTDAAMGTLMALFMAAPAVAIAWLAAETVTRRMELRQGRPPRSLWLAGLILTEAIILDVLIVSMAGMH